MVDRQPNAGDERVAEPWKRIDTTRPATRGGDELDAAAGGAEDCEDDEEVGAGADGKPRSRERQRRAAARGLRGGGGRIGSGHGLAL